MRQRAVLAGHTEQVMAVAIAPDGSWLASGALDNTVRIWDVATRRQRVMLAGHTDRVVAVAVAPDGSYVASASRDQTMRIWDAVTGNAQALMRFDDNVMTCAWLGSKALVVGGSAGLYLFDFLTGNSPPAAD
jgi:WD40 repeat protein